MKNVLLNFVPCVLEQVLSLTGRFLFDRTYLPGWQGQLAERVTAWHFRVQVEMYADPGARGGVLEPEGIVEIKFRTPDLIKAMHRLDPVIQGLKAEGRAGKDAAIKAREAALLPVYRQVPFLCTCLSGCSEETLLLVLGRTSRFSAGRLLPCLEFWRHLGQSSCTFNCLACTILSLILAGTLPLAENTES